MDGKSGDNNGKTRRYDEKTMEKDSKRGKNSGKTGKVQKTYFYLN